MPRGSVLLLKAENLIPKKRVNCNVLDFATKQRIFGLLNIDEDPSLSMTAGRAVTQLLLVCGMLLFLYEIEFEISAIAAIASIASSASNPFVGAYL